MGLAFVESLLDTIKYEFQMFNYNVYSTVISLLLLTVVFSLYWYLSMPRKLPPGPMGIPILGSIPFLGKQPHFTLSKLAKQYGQVFSIYLGSKLVIVLNDYDAIKETLIKQSDKFWSRPEESPFIFEEVRGVMPADNDTMWKTHRRFAIKTFRDVGVGKNTIEGKLMEEIQYFIKEFEKNEGKPFNPKADVDTTVANNICNILFGKRYDYGDKEFLGLKKAQDDILTIAGGLTVYLFLPWTRYIPGVDTLLKRSMVIERFAIFQKFITKQWNTHLGSSDKTSDDYTTAFIKEKEHLKASNSDELFTENVYCEQALGLMGAGMETTSTHIKWCIIYLINYPETQKKIQRELDEVIGKDRHPQWNDRLRTPYIEAFMMEVHRIVTLVPMNLPHSNVTEATLYGYRIPKRSYIVSNLWNIHHDPKLWNKPDEFKPERFLNAANEIVKPEYFIPFSLGKHSCLGENLARMESYLYLTSLLQRFSFEGEPGNLPSTETSSGGLINTPAPFKIIIKRRK